MSVLACDRLDCGNIMCDRLLFNSHYICGECWQELLAYKATWKNLTESQIKLKIMGFFGTEPGTYFSEEIVDIDEVFDRLTRSEIE